MKRILIATAAFALLAAPAAFAQDDHHDHHEQGQGQGRGPGPGPAPGPQGRNEAPPQGRYEGPPGRPGGAPGPQGYGQRTYPGPGPQSRYSPQDLARFRAGDRADHSQWNRFQRNIYAQRRFTFGAYVRPPGWYYHRWTFGEFLPRYFWGSNYWINDFGYFGLPYPPPGCIWVRYGNDALLVDRYTGEVVQVVYGLFY